MPPPNVLYLYCDQDQVCEYYSRNLIAPSAVIPLLGNVRPLSVRVPEFLFVTHLPVSVENRGFGDGLITGQRVPVTLEVSIPQKTDCKLPVLLVSKGKTGMLSVEQKSWNDYDKKKHIGAFILGEIPLSCVKSILFDRTEDQGRVRQPSPDLWMPFVKFRTAPKPIKGPSPLPNDLSAFQLDDVKLAKRAIDGLRQREKLRAASLLFIAGTTKWKTDQWITGVDSALQQFAKLDDSVVAKAIPGWPIVATEEGRDILPWNTPGGNDATEANRLYRSAFSFLSTIPYRVGGGCAKTTSEMVGELRKIADDEPSFHKELDVIARFLESPTTGPTLPDLLTALKERRSPPICTALLMLSRTPNDIEELVRAITVYRVDQVAARQAMTLWGALNGLHGVPARGQGFGKEIEVAWSFVEAEIDAMNEDGLRSFRPIGPKSVLKGKRLLDFFDIGKTEVVDENTVFKRFNELVTIWKKIPSEIAKAVAEGIVSERGQNSLAPFETMIPAKLAVLLSKRKDPVSRNEANRIRAEFLLEFDRSFKLDELALCRAAFTDEGIFNSLWRYDQAFWERAYHKAKPKVNKRAQQKAKAVLSSPKTDCANSAEAKNA